MSDHKRGRSKPPAADDPRYLRTCTRCGRVRQWTEPYCPGCGDPEFSLPDPDQGGADLRQGRH